jgi:hypothetical protein
MEKLGTFPGTFPIFFHLPEHTVPSSEFDSRCRAHLSAVTAAQVSSKLRSPIDRSGVLRLPLPTTSSPVLCSIKQSPRIKTLGLRFIYLQTTLGTANTPIIMRLMLHEFWLDKIWKLEAFTNEAH